MSKKIDAGIKKIKTRLESLDEQYSNKEKMIRSDLDGTDLSLKIQTILTDCDRFKKNIPHFDLLINEIYLNWPWQYDKFKPHERDFDTLKTLLGGISPYFEHVKAEESRPLQDVLDKMEEIREAYHHQDISPLVKMTSRPLESGNYRNDNVQFNLTACHFCVDRFQGSTL